MYNKGTENFGFTDDPRRLGNGVGTTERTSRSLCDVGSRKSER